MRVHIMAGSGRCSAKNGRCALGRVSRNGCLGTRTNGPKRQMASNNKGGKRNKSSYVERTVVAHKNIKGEK